MNNICLVTLPTRLTGPAAATIAATITESKSGPVHVDASALSAASTQTLQFVLALSAHCKSAGRSLLFKDPSHLVKAAFTRLGLEQYAHIEWKDAL